MSQSDYIKYKNINTRLSVDNNTVKQPQVFQADDYTNFKEFTLENTIENGKYVLNKITPRGRTVVCDMYKSTTEPNHAYSYCDGSIQNFNACPTNVRKNRIPLSVSSIYFNPVPQPLTIKQQKNASNLRTSCLCALNRSYTNKKKCNCVTNQFGIVR